MILPPLAVLATATCASACIWHDAFVAPKIPNLERPERLELRDLCHIRHCSCEKNLCHNIFQGICRWRWSSLDVYYIYIHMCICIYVDFVYHMITSCSSYISYHNIFSAGPLNSCYSILKVDRNLRSFADSSICRECSWGRVSFHGKSLLSSGYVKIAIENVPWK